MTYTREEQQQIGQTILAQLGGHKFKVMTGAHGFSWGNFAQEGEPQRPGLGFRIPRSSGQPWGGVRIELTPDDLYDVTFVKMVYKGSGFERRADIVSETHERIYADQLQAVFTKETGLDTHL